MSSVDERFEGLPAPRDDALTIYLLGPGFGEAQLVSLPGGKWLAVDSFRHEGDVYPLALIRHFDVDQIDALLVTHPDADHIRGAATICDELDISSLWTYPSPASLRDLLSALQREALGDSSKHELNDFLDALDAFQARNASVVVRFDRQPRDDLAPTKLHWLAPLPADVRLAQKELRAAIVTLDEDGDPEPGQRLLRALSNRSRTPPSRHSNSLSTALSLCWRGWRVILGGDVMADVGPTRGWRGILTQLRKHELTQLVRDVDVVKIAHHGSSSSYLNEACEAHAASRLVAAAICTPFRSKDLPSLETLNRLCERATVFGVSATTESLESWQTNAWHEPGESSSDEVEVKQVDATAPCVAVQLDDDSSPRIYVASCARGWLSRSGGVRGRR